MIVRRIAPMSLAKITGAIYGTLGLLFGGIFAVVLFFAAVIGSAAAGAGGGGAEAMGGVMGGLFGALAFAVLMPFLYAGIGFVGGLLTAWLYNIFAGRFGGVDLDLGER